MRPRREMREELGCGLERVSWQSSSSEELLTGSRDIAAFVFAARLRRRAACRTCASNRRRLVLRSMPAAGPRQRSPHYRLQAGVPGRVHSSDSCASSRGRSSPPRLRGSTASGPSAGSASAAAAARRAARGRGGRTRPCPRPAAAASGRGSRCWKSVNLILSVTVRPRVSLLGDALPDDVDDVVERLAQRRAARQVLVERALAAERLADAVGAHRPEVDAARGAVEVVGEAAEVLAQRRRCPWPRGRRRSRCRAAPSSPPPRGPTPWKRAHRQRLRRSAAPSPGRITHRPSGLFWSLASLARNLL